MKKRGAQLYLLLSALVLQALLTFGSVNAQSVDKLIEIITEKIKRDEPISINDFPGLANVPMPKGIKAILSSIELKSPKFGTDIWGIFNVTGTVFIKKIEVIANFGIQKKTGGKKFKIAFPHGVKFTESFPELGQVATLLDKFSIGRSWFILSSFDYREEELGATRIKRGLNLGATVGLTGPLQDLKKMIDEFSKTDFLIAEKFECFLKGVITPEIIKSELKGQTSIRLGIDFTKKPFNKKPFKIKNPYIRKIYTADIYFAVNLKGETRMSTGIFLELRDSKGKPIVLEFRGGIGFDAKVGAISGMGQMKGTYHPAFGVKWLTLGPNIGLEVAVMAVPPFITKIAIAAGMSLGDVFKEVQAIVAVDPLNLNFLLDASIKKLDIDDLIRLLISIGGKKVKTILEIPTIEFTDLALKVVPVDNTRVFDEYYRAGVVAKGGVHIGQFKGIADVEILKQPPVFRAKGNIELLDVKIKGKSILRITGAGEDRKPGTADDAAALDIEIAALRSWHSQKVYLSSLIEIPTIIHQEALINFRGKRGLRAKFSTKALFNMFTADCTFDLDTLDPIAFTLAAGMKQDFGNYVRKEVNKSMSKFENDAKRDLNKAREKVKKLDAEIKKYERQMEGARRKLNTGAAKQVRDFQAKIADIERRKQPWLRECAGVAKWKYPFKKCGRMLIKLEAEKTGIKIAKGTLQAGQRIISEATKVLRDLPQQINKKMKLKEIANANLKLAQGSVNAISKIPRAIVAGTFAVKKASFAIRGKDLKEGKSPALSMRINIPKVVTLDIKEAQFDFKKAGKFFADIAVQIKDKVLKKKK